MLTKRIELLRKRSLEAENRLDAERALLITEFYRHHLPENPPVPVHRAMAFDHFLRNKQLCILAGARTALYP